VEDEPVIYRLEVLTTWLSSATSGQSSNTYVGCWRAKMAKKKRKPIWTPEERAEFERRSAANLERLRELVDRGWTELERKGIATRPG
jgi:hypothetical protein